MKSTFISFEGAEACGKTTQIARLQAKLESLGHRVTLTREPGGTPLGEALRHLLKHAPEGEGMVPEAEILLFTAGRAQLARTVIAPALAKGHWVLSDRYGDSTTVYQGVARRIAAEEVSQINDFAMGGVRPSLTLILDLELAEAQRRLQARPRPPGQTDRIEDQPADFFERVREGYLALARRESERVKLLPAAGTPDEVEQHVWEAVRHAFCL
jgi:dTMP kinase